MENTTTDTGQITAFAMMTMDELTLFSRGFFAFQQDRYHSAIDCLECLLKRFPAASMRDMTLFWLSQAHFKAGNHQEAARLMAQFLQEYPDLSLMKQEVDAELIELVHRYKSEQVGSEQETA